MNPILMISTPLVSIRSRNLLRSRQSWATAWNVSGDNFSDAALVLIGHGSTLDEDSAIAVRQHATELRRRACFAEVREAFWKQEPQVKEVVARLTQPRVFLAPVF